MLRGHSPPRACFAKHCQSANRSADVQNSCGVALGLRGGRGALAQEVLGPRKCAREGCFTTPKPQRSHLAAHENARQHAAPHAPLVLDRHAILDRRRRAERGLAYPGQGPTRGDSSTDSGMLPLQGPLHRSGGRLWCEHGRLEQRQAPAGAGAWPGALAAGSWPLASGSARCACSSQPQAVCFGQQAGRHDALRRAEGELPGCSRRAAPAEPPGPSAAPDSRAEAESTKHAAF